MPIIVPPPPRPPVELPSDEGTSLWEVLYAVMGYMRTLDEPTGFQLLILCQVITAATQELYDLVRERPGIAAGALLLDPQNAPLKNLPFQAQFVGARLTANMDEAQMRAEIEQPATWSRGQVKAIELVAKRELTGEKWIRVRPATPSFGHIYIRTLLSETPDPARIELELLDPRWGIPAWDVLDYEAIDGVTVHDVASGWKTVAEVAVAFPTVDAVAHVLPDELPE